MPITATIRKKITKSLSSHTGIVPAATQRAIASKHHVKPAQVNEFLTTIGFFCENLNDIEQQKPPIVRKVPPPQVRAPSELVKRQVMLGGIYRQLGCDIDSQLEDEDWIVTTYGEWKKERAAIQQWIKSLGGEIPATGETE